MEDKFIATIYEKIELTENVFMFRRYAVLKEGTIDFKDGLDQLTYYDNEGKRITLDSMECAYTFVSDDRYCYGYPMLMEDLKATYPNIKTNEELILKYIQDLSDLICLSYYDQEEDNVKVITTNEEILKKTSTQDELIFSNFSVDYDSLNDKKISLPLGDVKKLIKYAKSNNNKKIKEGLLALDKNLQFGNDEIEKFLGMNLNLTDKEEMKEEKEDKNIEESLNKLKNLTGLENVKKEVNKLVDYLTYISKTKKYLKLEDPNLHMVFTGNPGTGKTTVARIIGEILYKLGYAKNNKFIEITPKDLIAGYVGQTAIKTAKVLEQNKGGVIFIDEAYVFASRAQEFADEALAEVLKELEKKETIFIFAGYKEEMQNFIEMNSGLTSRIGYYLDYKDYSKEELYQIFETKVTNMGFIIDDKLKDIVINKIEIAKNNKNFGNGRYIDKLIDKLILEHSVNTKNNKRKDKLITLTDKDFTEDLEETLSYKVKTKKIGF